MMDPKRRRHRWRRTTTKRERRDEAQQEASRSIAETQVDKGEFTKVPNLNQSSSDVPTYCICSWRSIVLYCIIFRATVLYVTQNLPSQSPGPATLPKPTRIFISFLHLIIIVLLYMHALFHQLAMLRRRNHPS